MPFQKFRLEKTKNYPRPHAFTAVWGYGLESAAANRATIWPVTMYDEAMGDPKLLQAHPEHASFVVAQEPNCYPESLIDSIITSFTVSLTKAALETDKIHALRFATMPIFTTFDDLTAIDELTSTEIQDVLEMQSESTDRQAFPLFNTVDMAVPITGSANLAANVPGLT